MSKLSHIVAKAKQVLSEFAVMVQSAPFVDFEAIRRMVPLGAILSHYHLDAELKRVGSQLSGSCPIHQATNPGQFVVDLKSNQWRCFGDCDRGGGSLELVAEIEHLDVRGAAKLVTEWFAIPPQAKARAIERHRKEVKVMSGKPSHKCFVVEDRGEGDDNDAFWTRVGSAWPHKDGKGLNVVLSALPTNGRLVLRDYTPEDEKVDDEKEGKKKSATRK